MPELNPPRSGVYRMASKAVGDVPTFLTDERGRGLSYRAIAGKLVARGLEVTPECVRLWCKRLGIA